MRLEEWQKWLDTQFIDPATVAQPPPAEPAVVPDGFDHPGEAGGQNWAVPAKSGESILAATMERDPTVNLATAPQTQSVRHEPVGLVDEIDMPSIEHYLPFLRAANPPPEPEPALVSPEPAGLPLSSATADRETDVEISAPPDSAALDPEPPTVLPTPAPVRSEPANPIPQPDPTVQHAVRANEHVSRRVATNHPRTRAPRSRNPADVSNDLANGALWDLVPKHIQTLISIDSDGVAQNSYKREFRETRVDLITRLLDPTLSLEDTARLLNVCPTTVRRYTNRGLLTHQRTAGDQRRFKLSDVLGFLEAQSRIESRPG